MSAMTKTIKNMWIKALFALSLAAVSSPALAASSGTATGTIQFYQNQGNFCPTTRNCTGAKYPQSQYNTSRPIKNVKVYLRRQSDNVVIGQGTTDNSGNFSISWSDPAGSGNVLAQLIWRGEQKDGRFRIAGSAGEFWIWWSNKTLTNGGNTSIGALTWGNSSSPHALSNLYDGAHTMWANSLAQSNRMNSFFTGVQVRAWDSATCPTSCADGPNNRIIMDDNSAYSPQGRILHEMGHIASYRASRDQNYKQGGSYCFGGEAAPCGWSLNGPENASVHFEEGVATHLGDVSLYFQNAPEPHTCLSSVACANNSFNVETSSGTSCAANVNRRPINAIRYFWDNYDSLSDYTGESLSRGVWEVVDTIHAFDNGADNNQKNEVWNAALTVMDDLDGRSAVDFRTNWNTWGTNSQTQLNNNCGSAGD